MRYITILGLLTLLLPKLAAQSGAQLSGAAIIEKVDENMAANNRIVVSEMIIHGKRRDRTLRAKTWSIGTTQSFTEYLSPARDAGTKMLKLTDKLWIYTPTTDRTIQIAGHLLRQSVMGSDMSYEDMMDDRKLLDVYDAKVSGKEEVDGRPTTVISLTAKVSDVAYHTQKMWVDSERFVPLRQELYAKSGQLLKRITLSDVQQIEGRWYPMAMTYKDMLKDGKGTGYRIISIEFEQDMPADLFTKAALRK